MKGNNLSSLIRKNSGNFRLIISLMKMITENLHQKENRPTNIEAYSNLQGTTTLRHINIISFTPQLNKKAKTITFLILNMKRTVKLMHTTNI